MDKLLKCKNLNANKLFKLLLEKEFDDFIKIINKRKFELFIKTILKTNFKEISIIYSIYLNKLLTFFSLNNGLFIRQSMTKFLHLN